MINLTPAPATMTRALRSIQPSERLAAAKLGEKVFFDFLNSPNMEDAHHPQIAREWAAEAASAEMLYRFA